MNNHDQKVLFSHESDEYETPQKLFDLLNKPYSFGPFDLDAAATKDNTKCSSYFSIDDDGLNKDWSEYKKIWINPPYSKVKEWVKKAYEESEKNNVEVVMLLPSRTDTRYWADYCMKAREIYFIKGRLKFNNMKNSAPFPSVICYFMKNYDNISCSPTIYSLEIPK